MSEVRHEVVVPYPRSNASVRARVVHWIERLEAGGSLAPGSVAVHGPGFLPGRPVPGRPLLLLRNARRFTRGGHESGLLRRASHSVYDLDDGLPWDDGNLPGLGAWYKRPFPRSVLAVRCAGAADRVVVGNEVLAEWAAQHCDDVRIVPTCVEPGEYDRRDGWELAGPPVIGWIGSPATEGYLVDVAGALAEVHARTGARLEMISGPGDVPSELAPFTSRLVWAPGVERRISSWDVGVMPLRDGIYERAKCGYKLLQYAASGVPAVGDPVGVNRRLLAEMDGLAPSARSEWIEALLAVLDEPASRRAERAAHGFEVARAYAFDTWEPEWRDAVGW